MDTVDTVVSEDQARAMAQDAGAQDDGGGWGAALDSMGDEGAEPQAPASSTPPPQKTEANTGGAGTPPQKAAATSTQRKADSDLPDDEDKGAPPEPKPTETKAEPFKGTPKQLREAYELTKREKAELEAKVRELSEARASGTKAEVEKATKELREEMDRIKKERDEVEAQVKFTRYQSSREYKEKFQQPLQKAIEQVISDIDGITMVGEDGQERPASWEDIEPIIKAPTARAAQLAKATFGDAASVILQNRAAIVRLQQEAKAAVDEYRKNGVEHERRMEEQARQTREQAVQKWGTEVESIVKERPSLFSKPSDDVKLAKVWDDGDAIVSAALLGKMPEGVSEEDRGEFAIQAQAQVAARARAFGVLAHRVHGLREENRRLQERLKKLEGAEPSGPSRRSAEPSPDRKEGWEAALDAL